MVSIIVESSEYVIKVGGGALVMEEVGFGYIDLINGEGFLLVLEF
tara:strand:- start:239 stop:373 length:135 start_codon:yes stop_codon:yes gene_type:complete